MTDVIHAAAAAILWMVVLYRIGMVRESGTQRSLWLALACLACGQTLQVEMAYDAVEGLAGVSGSAAIAKHVFALGAAAGVLLLLRGLTGAAAGVRRLAALGGLSLAAMLTPLAFGQPVDVPVELEQRAEFYGSSWPWVVHWVAFVSYLSWALAGATRLCAHYSRHASAGPLRTGLRLIGLGTAVGFGYVALKVVVVGVSALDLSAALIRVDEVAEAAILACSVVLIAIGSGYEALARRWFTLAGNIAMRRSLRRLHPLWRALCIAVPYIALSPATAGRSLLPVPFATRDQLYRRVMEIRDGLLALRPYAAPEVRAHALGQAYAAGLAGPAAAAVAEAVWLEVARRAKTAGAAPTPHARAARPVGGHDFPEEVRWLERIATAHASSPLVAQLVNKHHSHDSAWSAA